MIRLCVCGCTCTRGVAFDVLSSEAWRTTAQLAYQGSLVDTGSRLVADSGAAMPAAVAAVADSAAANSAAVGSAMADSAGPSSLSSDSSVALLDWLGGFVLRLACPWECVLLPRRSHEVWREVVGSKREAGSTQPHMRTCLVHALRIGLRFVSRGVVGCVCVCHDLQICSSR